MLVVDWIKINDMKCGNSGFYGIYYNQYLYEDI